MNNKPIVSENIRVRGNLVIGDFSIIDDFVYISPNIHIGKYCHIAPNCSISGGKGDDMYMDDFSFISAGCSVYTASDDFVNGLGIPGFTEYKETILEGGLILQRYSGIGAGSTVLPNVFPEGAVVGANSFVPPNFEFEEWGIYVGSPIRFLKYRNKKSVLESAKRIIDDTSV